MAAGNRIGKRRPSRREFPMFARRVPSARQVPETRLCRFDHQYVEISSTVEMFPLLDAVAAAMTALGYPDKDVFGMRLALEEALVNAIKHGHREDTSKQVRISYRVNARRVLVQIEDEGPGFDPHQVADPCAETNLDRPGGRGLLLMRHYATWLRYNRRGNCVALCKCRSDT
jgi:serine/threonine-protein kinase RsbW